MELYILRHAIAEEAADPHTGNDSQRRLTPDGAEKMRRAAEGMKEAGLEFDLILSSPYVRAKQTAEIVGKVLRPGRPLELSAALAPDGNPKELMDALRGNHGKRKRVLLVGHEPYLSRLVAVLISGDTRMGINFKKGALCKLTVTAGAPEYGRCAVLEWLVTCRQLRRMR